MRRGMERDIGKPEWRQTETVLSVIEKLQNLVLILWTWDRPRHDSRTWILYHICKIYSQPSELLSIVLSVL